MGTRFGCQEFQQGPGWAESTGYLVVCWWAGGYLVCAVAGGLAQFGAYRTVRAHVQDWLSDCRVQVSEPGLNGID